ncbi:MAG: APC family permease [Candidatus Dormiibacterota bacterium]
MTEPTGSGLRANALTQLDSLVMSLAGVAPGIAIAASTAVLFAAVGFAGPAALLYCGLAVFGIVWAFNYLGRSEVNAGASYAWVRRALHPLLGYLAGWALIVSGILAMVALSLPAGSVTLGLIRASLANNLALVTLVGGSFFLLMVMAVLFGVRISARAQLIMSGTELVILVIFGILAAVHGASAGVHSFSWSWLSPTAFGSFAGATRGFVAGALIAAFYYSGWDTNANLSEETKNPRRFPGRGSLLGVLCAFCLFQLFTIGADMNLSTHAMSSNSGDVLGVLGQVVWPGLGGRIIVVAVILSTVATLETSLIQGSRTLFAMGRDGTMPKVFAKIHPSWRTPWIAIMLLGVIVLALFVGANYIGSLSTVLSDAISAIGLQICFYYGLAGLSVVVLYRRHLLDSAHNFIFIGLWPLLGAIFMFVILGESVSSNAAATNWVGFGALALGLIPAGIFWSRGAAYFRRPPKEERVVGGFDQPVKSESAPG